jgi:hypothetical protein
LIAATSGDFTGGAKASKPAILPDPHADTIRTDLYPVALDE